MIRYTHQKEGGVCFFIMKIVTRFKTKTVTATNAEDFDKKFNDASLSIGTDVELRWDTAPMTVHFIYKETEHIPETIAEEFELRGEKYYCKNCPYFDRSADGRRKSGGCKYAEPGSVVDYTPACEVFYRRLAKGEIKARED